MAANRFQVVRGTSQPQAAREALRASKKYRKAALTLDKSSLEWYYCDMMARWQEKLAEQFREGVHPQKEAK